MKAEMENYYKQHAKVVRGYLFRLCQNQELTEELTQETFYQAVRSIERYRGECKPSVWLCQIARHVWYKYLEKNKHKKEQIPLEDVEIESPVKIEEQVIQKEDKLDLYRRMQMLNKEVREIMYLRILGELSFKEIGAIVGKTENSVRVTFYRGKEQLLRGGRK